MNRTIDNIEFDTNSAELLRKVISGYYGDKWGYEECLYRTPEGHYFIYGSGGEESPYPEAVINRVSPEKAEAWLKRFSSQA